MRGIAARGVPNRSRLLRDGLTEAFVNSTLAPLIGRHMGGKQVALD